MRSTAGIAVLISFLLTWGSPVGAQTSVHGSVERWSIASGHLGSSESRLGAGGEVRVLGNGGAARIHASWVPEGAEVDPGWINLGGAVGPALTVGPVTVSAELGVGAFRMMADNRQGIVDECQEVEGCFFEAANYESGWGMSGTVGGTATLELISGMGVFARHVRTRIVSGSNANESLRKWTVGAGLRLRD